ncbi:MAG: hypothetical protein PHG02_04695 [Oscillospiraceae bacterium]|nr:hypothetical protein [Oscillospiraceae bacterium]
MTETNENLCKKGKLHVKQEAVIFAALFLVISLVAVYFTTQKQGYELDELYSFGYANGSYMPLMEGTTQEYTLKNFIDEYVFADSFGKTVNNFLAGVQDIFQNGIKESNLYKEYKRAMLCEKELAWHDAEYFRNYITAEPGAQFEYLSVYNNMYYDNHPPFYLMLIHTMSSLFPGQFSKYMGFAINYLALMGSCAMLYALVKRLSGSAFMAQGIMLTYGLSTGFTASMTFYRMYGVLTFFTLWFVYAHVCLLQSDWVFTPKRVIALGASAILGFYTHYYFIVFAALLAFFTLVLQVVQKNTKAIKQYLLTGFCAGVISFIIWPFSIWRILFSYRSYDALEQLKTGDHWLRLQEYSAIVRDNVFAGSNFLLVLAVAAIITAFVLAYRQGKKKTVAIGLLMLLPVILDIFIISNVAPYSRERYIANTFPFIVAGVAFAVTYLFQLVTKATKITLKNVIIPLAVCVGVSAVGLITVPQEHLYPVSAAKQELLQKYEGSKCIFAYKKWSKYTQNVLDFLHYDETLLLEIENMDYLYSQAADLQGQDVLLYIDRELDYQEITALIKQNMHAADVELLSTDAGGYADIYHICW